MVSFSQLCELETNFTSWEDEREWAEKCHFDDDYCVVDLRPKCQAT